MGARVRRYGVGAALTLALGLGALAPVEATAEQSRAKAGDAAAGSDTLTMVHANIYTKLSPERFQKDVRKVMSVEPDVITYNEVPFRLDEYLAPEGYALYRDMSNRFTAATPVAWRTDRWTAIDTGRQWISNWRGRPPGREIELGRRVANWVTLQGDDGRVMSVISAHVAPPADGMPDLIKKSVRRLRALVQELAPLGPVLVGGDFNVTYTGPRYPRKLLDSAGLVPTFDVLGNYFPTHRGYTIDYQFANSAGMMTPTAHYPMGLKSDHDAVVADYSWLVDAPDTITRVRNQPDGDKAERRAVVAELVRAIDGADAGATVALRTEELRLRTLMRAMRRALERGVHVQVMTANDAPTKLEKVLTREVVASGDVESWVQACGSACLPAWRDAGMPRALLMVGAPTGAWTARYDTNRPLGDLVEMQSRVRVQIGRIALEDGARLLEVVPVGE